MSFLRPDLRALVPMDEVDGVVFRIGGFLEPIHLVGLASAAHGAARRGWAARAEVLGEAATYAGRMRLSPALDAAGCGHELPSVRERGQGGQLLEVSAIHDAQDVRTLAEQVRERVRRRSRTAADGLHAAIAEMGINVDEHAHRAKAGVGVKGFVAAQTMHQVSEWVFAVADFGVGMQETLRHRGARDDKHAITLAASGASRLDEVTRGRGIQDTVRHTIELGGSFYMATGVAGFTATGPHRQPHDLTHRYEGTILQVRLPLR